MKNGIAVKGVKIADKTVQTIIDIVFIIILLIGVYFLVDTIYIYNNARAAEVGPYKPGGPEDMDALKKVAKDAIGWITIDDTKVDYPIMQGKTNMEYLNKDPFGDYSLSGSIFLDTRNSKDFTDYYSVIYGHHMSGKKMFGALDDFEKKSFFEEHKKGTLITKRAKIPITVFAFLYTDARDEMIFEPEGDKYGIIDYVRSKAINFEEPDAGKKLMALTTCKSPTSTRRMIVFVTLDE